MTNKTISKHERYKVDYLLIILILLYWVWAFLYLVS